MAWMGFNLPPTNQYVYYVHVKQNICISIDVHVCLSNFTLICMFYMSISIDVSSFLLDSFVFPYREAYEDAH
jgi:hypothetical protein